MVKNDVGFVETDWLGAPHILAFDTIQPFRWTLVTIAETSAVVGALLPFPWTVAPRSPRSPRSPRTRSCLALLEAWAQTPAPAPGALRGSRALSPRRAAPSSPRSSTRSCPTRIHLARAPPASTSSSTSPSPMPAGRGTRGVPHRPRRAERRPAGARTASISTAPRQRPSPRCCVRPKPPARRS